MDRDDWFKIQKNWKYLLEELDTGYIVIQLRESPDGVVTREEEQRVRKTVIDADKAEKLLLILKNKTDKNPYRWFLVALKNIQEYIHDRLEGTNLDPPDVIAPGGESNTRDLIRNILLRTYKEHTGSICDLADIHKCVIVELQTCGVYYTWDQGQLRDFIFEVFTDLIYHRKKKKKLIENLKPRNAAPAIYSAVAAKGVDHVQSTKDVKQTTADELCEMLRPFAETNGLDESFLSKIRDSDIDGTVFSTMKDEDWEKLLPDLSFGKRRKLLIHQEELVHKFHPCQEGQQVHESFRKFDSPVSPTDCYLQGRHVNIDHRPRSNMIYPVRYMYIEGPDVSNINEDIGYHFSKFAAACLNDRVNGTFYVGISSDGKVEGITIDTKACSLSVEACIKRLFDQHLHDIVLRLTRSPKYIPVKQKSCATNCFVIEIDVVPTAKLVNDNTFFLQVKTSGKRRSKPKQILYRIVDGTVKQVSDSELSEFIKQIAELTELRHQQETEPPGLVVHTDLRKQLLNLFTGGSETLEDEIHPIIFLSPLDNNMDLDYMKRNLAFIKHFDARMIFDFDPASEEKGLYHFCANGGEQEFEVYTTDNFDKKREDFQPKNAEYLKNPNNRGWVFCNGYNRMGKARMGVFDWKQQRLEGFKEALQTVHSNIPPERGIAIFFLLSKDYDTLIEAADQVLLSFKSQWIVIAENANTADSWKNETVRRHIVQKKSVDNRCVLGMSWEQVNDTFSQILSPKNIVGCELPTSTGAFCTLGEKHQRNMCDLEILSRNQCENNEELRDNLSRETLRRRAEETFYRGGRVQWLNFWFEQDHVLRRQQHKSLNQEVSRVFKDTNRDDEKVPVVTLLHQPGSGGTTSAMQILWDNRQSKRCCVVKKLTDDTADQIVMLRDYGNEINKNAPLVLLDSEDEDKIWDLITKLEGKAKYASRNEDFAVFCIVLLCKRQVNLPRSVEFRTVLLKHNLEPWEQSWFSDKFEKLERKYKEDKKVDPQLLISFNILKTNFNDGYIKDTVRHFMNEISNDTKEGTLLRYLSLINAYDLNFTAVPISCFDAIFELPTRDKRLLHYGVVEKSEVRKRGWETGMSTSLKILVNESSQKRCKTIRITSSLLAKEILRFILEKTSLQTSSIMIEVLSSSIFDTVNSNTEKLLQVCKDIVKKRTTDKDGRHTKFSPLIMNVKRTEGSEKAAEVLNEVYEKTHDTMVLQQISRFYIDNKNWELAEQYAVKATELLASNSLLWDTRAQVYYKQLVEIYDRTSKSAMDLTDEMGKKAVLMAEKAMDCFHREQYLSSTHKGLPNNWGGYLGVLRVVYLLLELVQHFQSFTTIDDMHDYLVKKKSTSKMFNFLNDSHQSYMKSIGDFAFKAVRRIEDESIQLKGDPKDESRIETSFDRQAFLSLKENIVAYLGEDSDTVPRSFQEEEACEFRRRRVRRMGVTSLHGTFLLNYRQNAKGTLETVKTLMLENVNSEHCTAFDLVTMLNTVLALHISGLHQGIKTSYKDVLNWSKRLYDSKQPAEQPYLEAFLYLILFHLPTAARRKAGFRLCSEVTIRDALNRWKDAYNKSYPLQVTSDYARKKDTTLFFLGKGSGLDEIVYQKELLVGQDHYLKHDEFWRSDVARTYFQRIEGTLLPGGLSVHVEFELSGGNKFSLEIPTSLPTRKHSMWQKRVFFVLGFSWSGPKAYDVTQEDPSMVSQNQMGGRQTYFQSRPERKSPNLANIEKEIEGLQKEVDNLKSKNAKMSLINALRYKIQDLCDEKLMLLGED